ncbi:MAG: hypothetical protein ACI8T1_003600 [Verrucomicrobiales bacterium]|jgi:hypothetical protein
MQTCSLSVEALKAKISELPEAEYHLLREWFAERDQEKWECEIAQDSQSGALDFLKREDSDEIDSRSLAGL